MSSGVKAWIWFFVLLIALDANHAGWSAIAGAGMAVCLTKWKDGQ